MRLTHTAPVLLNCDGRSLSDGHFCALLRLDVRATTLRSVLCTLTLLLVVLLPLPAFAFGTVQLFGQDAEHEKITRAAFTCGETASPACFSPRTLDSLAGKKGTFGAVGAPDPGPTVFRFFAHCSGGDFLPGNPYPRSRERAQRALELCRRYMQLQMEMALRDAARLLDNRGHVRLSQTASILPCGFGEGIDQRAKCRVLKHFGSVLHAAQDFYAHTNWVDVADPTKPLGKDNPPGLGNRGPAPWLDLRIAEPEFPEGLISGCGGIDAVTDGEGGCASKTGRLRIHHAMLNKDNGEIVLGVTPLIGQGRTPRGRLADNFRHAVEAAIEDSADKWLMFREKLAERYGVEQSATMVCVLVSDQPKEECQTP